MNFIAGSPPAIFLRVARIARGDKKMRRGRSPGERTEGNRWFPSVTSLPSARSRSPHCLTFVGASLLAVGWAQAHRTPNGRIASAASRGREVRKEGTVGSLLGVYRRFASAQLARRERSEGTVGSLLGVTGASRQHSWREARV